MNKTTAPQAAALVLATVMTLATLAGIDHLATQQYAAADAAVATQAMAMQTVASQSVVVVGHRIRKA